MNACWVAPGILQASLDPKHTEHHYTGKVSLSLPSGLQNRRDADSGKTTPLYITYTAELRSDQDIFMLGLGHGYTNVAQANQRAEYLARCNENLRYVETKLVQKDPATGCSTVSLGRYGSKPRFVAQVKMVEMAGEVMQKDCRSTSAELWDHDQVGLFFAETHLDLANHVWVVAVHNPADTPAATDGISRRKSLRRRSSVSARSSMNITNILASIAEEKDGESGGLGWHIDSVHSNSDAALIRAKRAWNEHFSEQGRCKKVREHYGFARYALKPTVTNKRELDYETCFQIRIERIKVASESEMRGELLAGQASNTCMVPLPMTHTARRDSYLCIDGQRSSFLEDILAIADRSFEPGFDYEELPLAFKIRHDHMMRWGSLTDQRYGHEARERNSSADLYHALLYKPELLDEQSKSKQPSQAYKISRQRMANALEQSDHADSIHQDARDTEPGTATMMVPREPARFPLRVRKRATASSRADSAIGLSETRGLNEDIELVDLEPKVPRQDEAGTKSLRVLHDTGKRVTTDTQFMKLAETASTPSGGPTV